MRINGTIRINPIPTKIIPIAVNVFICLLDIPKYDLACEVVRDGFRL
jgi:hypothetical protein